MSELLKRDYSFANGEYNMDGEIEATEDGIEIDLGIIISWEWIDAARAELDRLQREKEDEYQSAMDYERGRMNED